MIVQVHAGDVDGLEPVLDFTLGALADVDEQTGVEHLVAVLLVEAVDVLLHPVLVLDGKFVGHEAAQARDALLPVKYLEIIAHLIEVDNPKGIALQHRINDGDITLAVGIDIVALVLGLDGEFTIHAEQAFTLQLVIDKALANLANSDVCP